MSPLDQPRRLAPVLRPDFRMTLVMLNLSIGLCYLWQSPNRETSDAYHNAKRLTAWLPGANPMRWWGVLFLLVVVALILVQHHEQGVRTAAAFGLGVWIFWAVLLASSGVMDGKSGFAGAILFGFGATRHVQVTRGR